MYLLVDAGNSRTKVGCHDGNDWLYRGVWDENPSSLPAGFVPQQIVVSCVARDSTRERLTVNLAVWDNRTEWLLAEPFRCGVRCAYEIPERLGADRWAAAIGAWHAVKEACLIVSAGTATTVDLVREPGVFEGGLILPGLSMMRESLARGTAKLPLADGAFSLPPRRTHDAIETGCLLAQVGAVTEMARRLLPGGPLILTGGNAEQLRPLLEPCVLHPWLVLDGLLAIAREKTVLHGT